MQYFRLFGRIFINQLLKEETVYMCPL